MDMHQRRPRVRVDHGDSSAAAGLEESGGACYLAPQSVLAFGSDRRRPTEYRHVVCVGAKGARRYLLPCTTARKRRFYRLTGDQCVPDPPRKRPKDSWLHYRVEVVSVYALTQLGVLVDGELPLIVSWLRKHRQEYP